jgi:hypothetical protein
MNSVLASIYIYLKEPLKLYISIEFVVLPYVGGVNELSLQDYRKKVEEEAVQNGLFYLRPTDVKVGDQVKIVSYLIEPPKTIVTKAGKSIDITEKIAVTGQFTPLGQLPTGQEVRVSISKAQSKKLFALWKGQDWVGKSIMVTAITTKPIQGESRTWIEWTGLP